MPGCSNCTFLEAHHFDLRSEGGAHDPERMGYLCSVHHAAVHQGRLLIEGRVSTGLRFLHADGTPYGSIAVSPARASMQAQLFGILKAMGFKEKEARTAADGIRDELTEHTPMAEAVRLALRTMPVPGHVSGVRERFAEYVRLDPAFAPLLGTALHEKTRDYGADTHPSLDDSHVCVMAAYAAPADDVRLPLRPCPLSKIAEPRLVCAVDDEAEGEPSAAVETSAAVDSSATADTSAKLNRLRMEHPARRTSTGAAGASTAAALFAHRLVGAHGTGSGRALRAARRELARPVFPPRRSFPAVVPRSVSGRAAPGSLSARPLGGRP